MYNNVLHQIRGGKKQGDPQEIKYCQEYYTVFVNIMVFENDSQITKEKTAPA